MKCRGCERVKCYTCQVESARTEESDYVRVMVMMQGTNLLLLAATLRQWNHELNIGLIG